MSSQLMCQLQVVLRLKSRRHLEYHKPKQGCGQLYIKLFFSHTLRSIARCCEIWNPAAKSNNALVLSIFSSWPANKYFCKANFRLRRRFAGFSLTGLILVWWHILNFPIFAFFLKIWFEDRDYIAGAPKYCVLALAIPPPPLQYHPALTVPPRPWNSALRPTSRKLLLKKSIFLASTIFLQKGIFFQSEKPVIFLEILQPNEHFY